MLQYIKALRGKNNIEKQQLLKPKHPYTDIMDYKQHKLTKPTTPSCSTGIRKMNNVQKILNKLNSMQINMKFGIHKTQKKGRRMYQIQKYLHSPLLAGILSGERHLFKKYV